MRGVSCLLADGRPRLGPLCPAHGAAGILCENHESFPLIKIIALSSGMTPGTVRPEFIKPTLPGQRDWGQEEKGTTEDEIVGWHHRLDGHEFE